MLSPAETVIIFVLALLLFGPEQLPKMARQLGEAMRHIRSTTSQFMDEMERAADLQELREKAGQPVEVDPNWPEPETFDPPRPALDQLDQLDRVEDVGPTTPTQAKAEGPDDSGPPTSPATKSDA